MKGHITMSNKEVERISVMENLMHKIIKQKQAALQLDLTVRQIGRTLKRYRKEGKLGLLHQARGKTSNRAIPDTQKARIVSLIKEKYSDFGPTFACEKLQRLNRISLSDETIRNIMVKANLWIPKKRKLGNTHPYRERRACVGELIQLDGSYHDWFEGRGNSCALVAFVDDATSRIMDGMFVDHEGTMALFESTGHYLNTYGKPLGLYVDRHSTFKINRQATIEEDLRDKQAQTQFARAMDELGITIIFAYSPQSKGRVERLFGTLQDRLVKELRLKGISTQKEATKYFREEYIPMHNEKFAVCPKDKADLHRSLLPSDDLNKIFTIQSKRIVSKDLLVQYKNTRYQLKPSNGYRYTLRGATVTIMEDKYQNLTFNYKNITVPYQIAIKDVFTGRPIQVVSSKEFVERRVYIPADNHPWRHRFIIS
ncbi:MAG: ISNCY family transposase [Patescibacteria group bacterium]